MPIKRCTTCTHASTSYREGPCCDCVSQSNWTQGAPDYTRFYAGNHNDYKHKRYGIPYHKRPCTEKQQKYIDVICFELFSRVSRHKYTMYEANKFITKYEQLFKQHVRARKAGRVFDTIAVDYNKGPHYGADAQITDDLDVQATVLRAYAEWNKQNETGYTFGDAPPDSIPSVEPLDSKDISTWFDELYKE